VSIHSCGSGAMGQSASLPEKVLKACDRGDVAYLQRQLNQGAHSRERLQALANSTNKVNQTALFLAVRGDHVAVVQMLLTAGADVSAHTGGNGPTALHEAARRRNLQVTELLLSYGANPFQQCSTGHTAFETAMLADAKPIVRRFAQMARWAGDVEVRSSGFFGSSWKSRHVKVVDHFLPPAGGVRPPAKRQLWVYASAASIAPKCRLWLDGAVAFVSGATAVLVGHTRMRAHTHTPYYTYTHHTHTAVPCFVMLTLHFSLLWCSNTLHFSLLWCPNTLHFSLLWCSNTLHFSLLWCSNTLHFSYCRSCTLPKPAYA